MPDIDTLMQEWSPEFEELLGKVWKAWVSIQLRFFAAFAEGERGEEEVGFNRSALTLLCAIQVSLPTADIDCNLAEYTDMICGE